jgi:hypothetical protein
MAAGKLMELKPEMSKEKALTLILDYVSKNGYPVGGVILHGDIENDNGQLKMVNEWSYERLCKFLIEQ